MSPPPLRLPPTSHPSLLSDLLGIIAPAVLALVPDHIIFELEGLLAALVADDVDFL